MKKIHFKPLSYKSIVLKAGREESFHLEKLKINFALIQSPAFSWEIQSAVRYNSLNWN